MRTHEHEDTKDGVIIADNDVIIRGILRTLLTSANQNVFLATNGEEAITLASAMQAKLVILDLEMPRLNGFLACKQIRSIPGYERAPIVILTNHDNPAARRAAGIVGVSLFLTKPFQLAVLLKMVSPFLDLDPAARHDISRKAADAAGVVPVISGRAQPGR